MDTDMDVNMVMDMVLHIHIHIHATVMAQSSNLYSRIAKPTFIFHQNYHP